MLLKGKKHGSPDHLRVIFLTQVISLDKQLFSYKEKREYLEISLLNGYKFTLSWRKIFFSYRKE